MSTEVFSQNMVRDSESRVYTSITIHVASDFSRFPGGRYLDDGPFSAESFRDNLLVPALIKHDHVNVELDGTMGYGSNFLEESFGGLVSKGGFTREKLKKLVVQSSNDVLKYTITRYIEEALKASECMPKKLDCGGDTKNASY